MVLFDEFTTATYEIAEELGVEKTHVKLEKYETPRLGVDYMASSSEGTYPFNFHLRTETENEDPTVGGIIKATLEIWYSEGVAPFYFHEEITYLRAHSNFLSRWAAWALFNFNLKHNRVDLESLFHDVDIRVYGLPGYNTPSMAEAEILFRGLLSTQRNKLIVFRFRHIEKPYLLRDFSYAILVDIDRSPPYWVFLPQFAGLDSGGSHSAYRQIEGLIEVAKKKLDVEMRKYDIEYDKLDRFLLKHESGFYSIIRDDNLEQLYDLVLPPSSPCLEELEGQYKKFLERFENKEYPQALRDLRALIQQAQENLAKSKKIDISHIRDPDVNKLAGLLIQNRVIDGRLQPWFHAFSSIANMAAHKSFPTEEDMKDDNARARILMTFLLGKQLMLELDAVTKKRKRVKMHKPSVKIVSTEESQGVINRR